ncbi:unnamed protein product [Triticum turgidum subsp. durum]|uniref:RRM domain-containing protein n=1 Tax=Triticum turgidum subsp. durum TaxID=4567 RepID=A0A9R0ZDX5_TRITD|nr:unnamed protein product [Triticum turgidum subsp. durum]
MQRISKNTSCIQPTQLELRARIFLTSLAAAFVCNLPSKTFVVAAGTIPPRHADGRGMRCTLPGLMMPMEIVLMSTVVRDKRTGKTKGYGFVSFSNPTDLAAAIKEMNGKYVGNRPIKLRKSNWKERTDVEALQRQKNHIQKKPKTQKKGILHK